MTTTGLSIVVPVLDEAPNVPVLVREVFEALPDVDVELIVVDDGSTDETVAAVIAAARGHPGLRLLRHPSTLGQSTAVWNGVRAARHDWVGILDGDLQNDPADLRRLVQVRNECLAAEPAG